MTALPPRHNFHPAYRPDIDGLRALAVLPVLAYHAWPAAAPGGFVGVDVFFVISGYLIGLIILGSLQRGDFRLAEFYAHRVRRIFPALALVLAASLAAGWWLLLPQELRLLGKHVAASAAFVQNLALQREAGYFDVASDAKPLLHLWSLAVEEQFYLAFPLLAWGAHRLGAAVLRTALLLAGAASLALAFFSGADPAGAFFWPHTRAWELLAGALLAHAQLARAPQPGAPPPARAWQHAAAWLGLAALAASVALPDARTRWPGPATLAPVAGAVLLIAAGGQAWPNRRLLAWRPLVWVGLISYPLYLWHWPLLALLRISAGGEPTPAPLCAAALLASVLLAALTWRFVERPLRRARPGARSTALLCGALALLGAAGWALWASDGLPARLPRPAAQALALQDTHTRPWLPAQQQPECLAQFRPPVPEPLREYLFCRSQPGGAPANVLLLGDSHAVSLYPGLAAALAGTPWHVQQVGASFAAPLWGLAGWAGSPATDELLKLKHVVNQEMRRFTLERPQLHTVILAARWPAYVHASGFGATDGQLPTAVRSYLQPRLTEPADMFEASLRATLAELTTAGRQVLLVLDSPELGFDPRSCVQARPWSWNGGAPRSPCALPRADYEARSHTYRARVAAVQAQFPQLIVVDGAQPFCDARWCWAERGGELLYYDGDHVSLAGATLMGQAIRRALEQHPSAPR